MPVTTPMMWSAETQQRPLLDVQFEVGGSHEAERLARQIGKRRLQSVERLTDADATGIAHGADLFDVAHAGKGLGAHHARRETAAFLIHPGDDNHIARRRFALFRQRDHRLKRSHHARRAIELSAGRLAVEMTADENGRRRAIAPGKRQEQIAGRIGRRRQTRLLRPTDHATPGRNLAVAQRLAVDAAGRRRADLGERHQPRPEPIGVDQGDGRHRIIWCA
jgi:hypothetical protein